MSTRPKAYRLFLTFALALLLCISASDSLCARAASLSDPKDRPNLLLSDQDAALYQDIFTAQAKGDMDKADAAIAQLKDKRLLGHVLYQRYLHPTAYISSLDELASWLDFYADHPGAEKIYDLAVKKAAAAGVKMDLAKPKELRKVTAVLEPTMVFGKPYHKHKAQGGYDEDLEKSILSQLRSGKRNAAIDKVYAAEKSGTIPPFEADYLKSKIAESYLYNGHVKMAYEIAAQAFTRSGDKVPLAGWIYGLATWYNGNYDAAARGFESAAISEYESGWMQAAASFWAARAYDRLGHPHQVRIWLTKAMAYPRTFYGLLATQASGSKFDFNWSTPPLTRDMVRAMAQTRATMRALALMDVGRYDWAEQEFLYVDTRDKLVQKAMLAFAQSYNMAELSIRLGAHVQTAKGQVYDAALYPSVRLDYLHSAGKDQSTAVDPALLHAIARQESRFNPYALSFSGAMGLMQIMPSTADYVAKRYDLVLSSSKTLLLPDYNLKFGQYYLHDLLNHSYIKDDLVATLISYNAGPGNYKRWRDVWPDVQDPLLFIELLPAAETRKYVERVLANYWIYRIKDGRKLDVLKPMIQGQPLTYAQASEDLPYDVAQWGQ